YLLHQGRLPRTAHARDAREGAERDGHVDVLQVVLSRPENLQPAVPGLAADLGCRDHATTREKSAGDGLVGLEQALEVARVDDLAAALPRAGTDVHEVV